MDLIQCTSCQSRPIKNCDICDNLYQILIDAPDWFRPGQKIRSKRSYRGDNWYTGTISEKCSDDRCIYIDWDTDDRSTRCSVEIWINTYKMEPIGDIRKHKISDSCPDCKGTGEYRGLHIVEPCQTCC